MNNPELSREPEVLINVERQQLPIVFEGYADGATSALGEAMLSLIKQNLNPRIVSHNISHQGDGQRIAIIAIIEHDKH